MAQHAEPRLKELGLRHGGMFQALRLSPSSKGSFERQGALCRQECVSSDRMLTAWLQERVCLQ